MLHSAVRGFIALTTWTNVLSIILQVTCLEGTESGRIWGVWVNTEDESQFYENTAMVSVHLSPSLDHFHIYHSVLQLSSSEAGQAGCVPLFGRQGSWDFKMKATQAETGAQQRTTPVWGACLGFFSPPLKFRLPKSAFPLVPTKGHQSLIAITLQDQEPRLR